VVYWRADADIGQGTGTYVGALVDGARLGPSVVVGAREGADEGSTDGVSDGSDVGANVGMTDGTVVGTGV